MLSLKKTLNAPPWIFINNPPALRESVRDFLGLRSNNCQDSILHVRHLAEWLCRAQDASGDGGVSRSYTLHFHPFFQRRGWLPSYPETTGYIIPTFFDLFHIFDREDLRQRAIAMADWECSIQMDSGAVMGGTVDFKCTPAIFNTGQVIFGWCRAFRETGNSHYLDCACRAGDFLVSNQDGEGAWYKASSRYANSSSTVYNTRCSWALLLLEILTGQKQYRETAVRNLNWALGRQKANGWFAENCLDDPSQPLIHTIGYAVQGLLESGMILGDDRYLDGARKTSLAVANLLRKDGSLAGRYDENWKPTVTWSCLTGNMQMSVVWSRLNQIGLTSGTNEIAHRINCFNKNLHDWQVSCGGQRGGVKGSHPIYGDYGSFEYLNWAAKFTIDALLMEQKSLGYNDITKLEQRGIPLFWGS